MASTTRTTGRRQPVSMSLLDGATDLDFTPIRLADVLRTTEDLDKIPALKADLARKKAVIDNQLKAGLTEQLNATNSGMNSLTDGQKIVNQIKEEMMKIDKLCAEAQNMIRDFPNMEAVSRTHRNFSLVETMKSNLETFHDRLEEVMRMLEEDSHNVDEMPNLLPIHYELSKLRDIRDEALQQVRTAQDASAEATLEDYFANLDTAVEKFDEHLGNVCLSVIQLVVTGNTGLVVRAAIIIEEEEQADAKATQVQDVQDKYREMARRFKSMNVSQREPRGYKANLITAIRVSVDAQFANVEEKFFENPDNLTKLLRWFYNDLNAIKSEGEKLFPPKWKMLRVYGGQYHAAMHDFLLGLIDNPDIRNPEMLKVIEYVDKYYERMEKLGFPAKTLKPHVINNREEELIDGWRSIIIKALKEQTDRMFEQDRKHFVGRTIGVHFIQQGGVQDSHGYNRTPSHIDFWAMIQQQLSAAGTAGRSDVVEGVVEEMLRNLERAIKHWERMLTSEANKHIIPGRGAEGYDTIFDWLLAIANDQITCIDDGEEGAAVSDTDPNAALQQQDDNPMGFLTRFETWIKPLVTPSYLVTIEPTMNTLRNSYIDLATVCVKQFVTLIIAVDFPDTLAQLFTRDQWLVNMSMTRLVQTFDDYLKDYVPLLHRAMYEVLIEEISDSLLTAYLVAVRKNKSKGSIRRIDNWSQKIRDDIIQAFNFFTNWTTGPQAQSLGFAGPSAAQLFQSIRNKWRVCEKLEELWRCDKRDIVVVYTQFRNAYWDLDLTWMESVLRARDDFEKSMWNGVKARHAELTVSMGRRGEETIMSKVM